VQRTDLLPRAALLLLASAAGCARDGSRSFKLLRLFEAGRVTLKDPDGKREAGERAAPPLAMAEVAGEARPAIVLATGTVASVEAPLPDEPCWLDVAAARLDDAPGALSDAPLVLDVAMVAGAQRTVLLHALPGVGTRPTALGWAHARIEIHDHLGQSVRFEFRLEAPPEATLERPAPVASFALADPLLAPRVDAGAQGWNLVDWLAPGPSADELAAPDAAKKWPGHARLLAANAREEVATATPPRSPRRAAATWAGARAPELELQLFGCELPADSDEVARRGGDRFARADPFWSFTRDADDPALHALAQMPAVVRADRARVLGERTFCLELARPRRAPLCVEITSTRGAAECDAALARLQDFLAADELLERTLLLVRTVPADGAANGRAFAIAHLPRGWRERAPAELRDRFEARAPEFAAR
jgi:hypothetical protein